MSLLESFKLWWLDWFENRQLTAQTRLKINSVNLTKFMPQPILVDFFKFWFVSQKKKFTLKTFPHWFMLFGVFFPQICFTVRVRLSRERVTYSTLLFSILNLSYWIVNQTRWAIRLREHCTVGMCTKYWWKMPWIYPKAQNEAVQQQSTKYSAVVRITAK